MQAKVAAEASTRRYAGVRMACCCAIALLLYCGAPASAPAASVVRAGGTRLELDKRPFRVYGFNYDFNGTHLNVDYLHRPTRSAR